MKSRFIPEHCALLRASLHKLTNIRMVLAGVMITLPVAAATPVPLEITEVKPVRVEQRGQIVFADFGKDAYGNLKIEFATDPPAAVLKVRLGEKLAQDGTIDRVPPGSVNYRELSLSTRTNERLYRLQIPAKQFHKGSASVKTPPEIGEVTPYRYAEIEGAGVPAEKLSLRQLFVHAPFNDQASSFECSDETLNAVWDICKYTMKATTAFGVYIDGERERIPYEADAYINQLSHYACDPDPRVARQTIEHLLKHPTWPTEWSLHMPMMAAEDYRATGDPVVARENYKALEAKLLMSKARGDGLLRAGAIVDWPEGERDGYNNGGKFPNDRQLGPEYNTAVNAFFYHALEEMASLARALNKNPEADQLAAKAKQVYESFNRVFFNPATGLYTDGEGSTHSSLHANMFALAFGLTPAERQAKVADFVQSRGMACSVYGAQYLLEALYATGRSEYALQLMTAKTERSWWHMIELGSTMTLEAWDAKFKRNLTWNHAWGAAPANIISRFVLGVRPIEPGYSKILVAPQPGSLKWVRGKVPTMRGPVSVSWQTAPVCLEVGVPPGATARVVLPGTLGGDETVFVDGKSVRTRLEKDGRVIEELAPGSHTISFGNTGKHSDK